jgi:predicted phage terminase large subunit-like protein
VVEADSKQIRDKTWDWYTGDLRPRLKPGAAQILIMTRYHDDDLAARLIAEDPKGWRIVSLPMEAIADDPLGRAIGEPLWPEWYTDDMRAIAKRDARLWSSQYQQQPVPDTGDYFRREWFVDANPPPIDQMRVYGGSDYAVTSDGGDYTVHVVVGLDQQSKLHLLDVWRRQAASDVWVEALCDLILKWKPIGWAEETGQIKAGVGPWIERRMRERRAFVLREQFPTRGDKATRAQSIRGMMSMDGLRMRGDAAWKADLISECLRFPAGVHDDQVDALGLAGQLIDKMWNSKPAVAPIMGARSGYAARTDGKTNPALVI